MDGRLGSIADDMEARYREKERLTLCTERTKFLENGRTRRGGRHG